MPPDRRKTLRAISAAPSSSTHKKSVFPPFAGWALLGTGALIEALRLLWKSSALGFVSGALVLSGAILLSMRAAAAHHDQATEAALLDRGVFAVIAALACIIAAELFAYLMATDIFLFIVSGVVAALVAWLSTRSYGGKRTP